MRKYVVLIVCFCLSPYAHAKTVEYNFDISTVAKNITGKQVVALAISGKIPGPTIEATVGDTLRVTFTNKMNVESSIHWHGVLLPNEQDGVPYLNTQPIRAHSSFTFEYPIIVSGTYWYHSHTGLQEQSGVYGSIVFHPKYGEKIKTDKDYVVVFSDWTNENPRQVMKNLKKDGDFYALKKGSVQSWAGVLKNGWPAVKYRLDSSWTRMGPMDLSDVGYDAFLANGKKIEHLKAKSGQKVRLRLINAAASSYFIAEYAGGPMTIVGADGLDVKPVKVKQLRLAVAETYDVIVDVPDGNAYELRNTSEDGTGYASTFIGSGKKVFASTIKRPNLFLVDHSSHGMHDMDPANRKIIDHSKMDHSKMGHMMTKKPKSVIAKMEDYAPLVAIQDTTLPKDRKIRTVNLVLTGNMERYVWSFNNKTLSESDKILIKKGENVRFVLTNETMMHHPLHLHGHFFRVLNGQGKRSPLKHTVNVQPLEKIIIEFAADEKKDWFFHCHNLYHMNAGMSRIISYGKINSLDNSMLQNILHDSDWYYATDLAVYNNMTMGEWRASNTRNAIEVEYDYDYHKTYDVDVKYERSITRFLEVYLGGNFERDEGEEDSENTLIAGVHYVLPLLVESDFQLGNDGHVKLGLGSDLQLTARTKFEWDWDTDNEYRLRLNYEISKQIIASTIYDSDNHAGIGIRVKF